VTDLRFSQSLGPQPGGAVALLFGYTGAPPPTPDPPSGALRLAIGAPWARAAGTAPAPVAAPWQPAQGKGKAWGASWAAGALAAPAIGLPWARTGAVACRTATAWRWTTPAREATGSSWQQTLTLRAEWVVPSRQAAATQRSIVAGWRTGIAAYPVTTARWAGGRPINTLTVTSASAGQRSGRAARASWRAGTLVVSHGGPWVPPTVGPAPATPCYLPDPGGAVGLIFRETHTGLAALVFACRRTAIKFVPVRRVYMVTNTTTLRRVVGDVSIPCFGLSLSLDVDSWAWGFSASLPADALSLIEPSTEGEPVELEAVVNGTAFRLIAESLGRDRTFGQASVRVQGRGKTAVLDAPYSALQVFSAGSTLTSQQLLNQALPTGWTADWHLTAWSVPGGVWSHQGTPISAALAIAAAGGGYVQPHASASSITVLPRYPVAPWDWGSVSPDIEVPAAVMTREGIEWVEKARYNRVYVSGTNTGVLGRVTRTGTAGDVVAQMVTDPLITHVNAARQRGLPVLADTGRIAYVTLRMPVLAESGVIRPGQFVRYTDGSTVRLGLARSVSVDVALSEVWQTIKVETHVN